MLKSYLKIAWRNLLKHKAFSVINIGGLSIGIAVCFIILLFVQDELSYDRFNAKADRTYRIEFKANINGGKINEANVMPPVAGVLKKDYAEVEEVARLTTWGNPKITVGNKHFKDHQMVAVDPSFFSVFNLPLIKGDVRTALLQPNTVIITKAMAQRFFGTDEVIGKVITVNNNDLFTITGLIDAIPSNAHFHFDLFVSMSTSTDANNPTWMASGYYTYIVLKDGYNYKKLEAKLPDMVKKYMGPQIMQHLNMNLSQFRTKGNELGFILRPLTDIHLHGNSSVELEAGGDARYVFIFGAVAVFMLLIACINFVNLSTAGASKRAKEVGIRKVLGSLRFDLIKQFLMESLLITLLAVLLAFVLVVIAIPVFNDLSGKSLSPTLSLAQVSLLLLIGLLVSILAGAYPAFYLSSFQPIATLRNRLRMVTARFNLRSGLVVFQFFISVCLITATIVVHQQMQYIQNKKLGYDRDQLIVVSNSWALGKQEQTFKDQLLNDPRVMNVTVSGYKPAGHSFNNNSMAYPAGKENMTTSTLEYKIDERYIPTLGIEMAAGRNFGAIPGSDSLGMIINETAARTFGFGDHAVGERIMRQNSVHGNNVTYTVIGVVKDFHFRSLHEAITPLLMVRYPETGLIIKAKTKDVAGLLSSMKQQWDSFTTEEPFSWSFMDDLYNKTYLAEQKTARLLNIFAVLTILVACLGLFGLATYTVQQRSKEIGIRKVLGASVTQVTRMLSASFVKLVLIGCVIAFPLSYWLMSLWLQDFAYRVTLSWWFFAVAGICAVGIAILTVSIQAIKAAVTSPVKSLKTEA